MAGVIAQSLQRFSASFIVGARILRSFARQALI
jgi:hypothetical protein